MDRNGQVPKDLLVPGALLRSVYTPAYHVPSVDASMRNSRTRIRRLASPNTSDRRKHVKSCFTKYVPNDGVFRALRMG
eukprot:5734871-Pyramimonas_sp.AAC.1